MIPNIDPNTLWTVVIGSMIAVGLSHVCGVLYNKVQTRRLKIKLCGEQHIRIDGVSSDTINTFRATYDLLISNPSSISNNVRRVQMRMVDLRTGTGLRTVDVGSTSSLPIEIVQYRPVRFQGSAGINVDLPRTFKLQATYPVTILVHDVRDRIHTVKTTLKSVQ